MTPFMHRLGAAAPLIAVLLLGRWAVAIDDLAGRKTSSDDPDAGTTTLTYDDAGRVTSTTDARGETVSTAYDVAGRPVTRWDGPVNTGTLIAEWVYDTLADGKVVHPDGRSVAFRHAAGVVHWDPASLPDGVPARLYAEAEFSPRETRAATADDRINSYALPQLIQETLDAQSADIDMVSGATVTSGGYLQSLQSALDQAR